MKVRVNKNLWTNFDWWDQLVVIKNQILVRNVDETKKVTSQLVLAESQDKAKLKQLLDFLHVSALKNEKSFNVENWMNHS